MTAKILSFPKSPKASKKSADFNPFQGGRHIDAVASLELPVGQAMVLTVLMSKIDFRKFGKEPLRRYESMENLAAYSSMSESAATRNMNALVKAGYVAKSKRYKHGLQAENEYEVLPAVFEKYEAWLEKRIQMGKDKAAAKLLAAQKLTPKSGVSPTPKSGVSGPSPTPKSGDILLHHALPTSTSTTLRHPPRRQLDAAKNIVSFMFTMNNPNFISQPMLNQFATEMLDKFGLAAIMEVKLAFDAGEYPDCSYPVENFRWFTKACAEKASQMKVAK